MLTGIGSALAYSTARGGPDKYEFELVDREVRQGGGTTVTVRLVDVQTGKLVPDAVVFISRLDMSPDNMGDMTAELEPMPDMLPGYYQFATDLLMAGGWALTLAANVPGVARPVHSRLVLQAVP